MKDEVIEILAKVFKTDKDNISDDISQSDFEKWDSLQHLNLMVELEKKYNTTFEPEEIVEMINIDKIINILQKKTENI